MAGEPAQAISVLQWLEARDVGNYQPYSVTLAIAQAAAGNRPAAEQALQTAIGLTEDAAVRDFLTGSFL